MGRVCVCERGGQGARGVDVDASRKGYEASGKREVRTEGPKGEKRIREEDLPGIDGRGVRVKRNEGSI